MARVVVVVVVAAAVTVTVRVVGVREVGVRVVGVPSRSVRARSDERLLETVAATATAVLMGDRVGQLKGMNIDTCVISSKGM